MVVAPCNSFYLLHLNWIKKPWPMIDQHHLSLCKCTVMFTLWWNWLMMHFSEHFPSLSDTWLYIGPLQESLRKTQGLVLEIQLEPGQLLFSPRLYSCISILLSYYELFLQFGFLFSPCPWLFQPGSVSVNMLKKGPLTRGSGWPRVDSLSILDGIAVCEIREFGYMVKGLRHLDIEVILFP